MNQNRITPKFLGPVQGNDQDIIDLTCSDDENEERSEVSDMLFFEEQKYILKFINRLDKT